MRFLIVLALAAVLSPAQQTHFVPSTATPTIASATAIAAPGDTIQLAAGSFHEEVTLPAGVDLVGAGKGLSIIDGDDLRRGVVQTGSGAVASTIRDLGITRARSGQNTAVPVFGSGIACYRPGAGEVATLRIERCEIHHCLSRHGGAAIGVEDEAPGLGRFELELVDCDLHDCGKIQIPANPGGSLFGLAVHAAGLEARGCRFERNLGDSSTAPQVSGSAIYNQGKLELEGCHFEDNDCSSGGTVFQFADEDVSIASCRFISGHCGLGGSAIWQAPLNGIAKVEILDCLFVGNSSLLGNGVIAINADEVDLVGCTFTGNQPTPSGQSGIVSLIGNEIEVRNCISHGNGIDRMLIVAPVSSLGHCLSPSAGDFGLNSLFQPHPGTGMLHGLDPAFVDEAGLDFRLRPGSPALDAGLDLPGDPALDVDGLPRVVGMASDIGCHELQQQDPGPAFAGTTSSGDLLRFNGAAGGITRTVTVAAGSLCTLSVAEPIPGLAAPFILWGHLGVPGAADLFPIPFAGGAMAFTPHLVDVGNPRLFTMTNNLLSPNSGIFFSTPAPWSVTGPAVGMPITMTLQGVIADGSGPLHITNAMVLHAR